MVELALHHDRVPKHNTTAPPRSLQVAQGSRLDAPTAGGGGDPGAAAAAAAAAEGEEEQQPLTRLLPFGSYRLDVHDPSSDLDLLLVAPRGVGREDFFASFVARLRAHQAVAEVCPVPEAYTPVVKVRVHGELKLASMKWKAGARGWLRHGLLSAWPLHRVRTPSKKTD